MTEFELVTAYVVWEEMSSYTRESVRLPSAPFLSRVFGAITAMRSGSKTAPTVPNTWLANVRKFPEVRFEDDVAA